MQKINENLNFFAENIKKIGGDVEPIKIKNPATTEQVENLEKNLGFELPQALKEVFLNFSAGIDFYWDILKILDENEDFLPEEFCEICSGELNFDIDTILDHEENRKGWISEVYPNYEDEYDRIYHNKLAFQKVRNGDLFAIDLEPESYGKIVYLSHDGSENHGRVMANDFKEFLLNYSAIGCAGAEDWYWEIFCDDNGINGNGEMAKKWQNFIKNH